MQILVDPELSEVASGKENSARLKRAIETVVAIKKALNTDQPDWPTVPLSEARPLVGIVQRHVGTFSIE